ncbi:MAG: hypothetical protein JST51_16045 [Armatimonadetes bacterium]|nr:hypothetical protein [Armatimonadota bacterium]
MNPDVTSPILLRQNGMGNQLGRGASLALTLSLLVSCAIAKQGGAGGGFGGGGFQGSSLSSEQELSYPPANLNTSEWDTKSMILTQGDRVEWTFKGSKGKTMFATVRSEVFDPALKLVDKDGKTLVENDDQYPGNQSPFVMYQFKDDEDYKLIVQNYHGTAGGRFDLYMQTLDTVDVGMGESLHEVSSHEAKSEKGGNRIAIHLTAIKDHTYDLRQTFSGEDLRRLTLSRGNLVGPTGVKQDDFRLFTNETGSLTLFQAKKDGEYYLLVDAPAQSGNLHLRLGEAVVRRPGKLEATSIDLKPKETNVVLYGDARGDIVRTQWTIPTKSVDFSYQALTPPDLANPVSQVPRITEYRTHITDLSDEYRIYSDPTEECFVLTNTSDQPAHVDIKRSFDLKEWTPGTSVEGTLALGESHFYVIRGKRTEIQRLIGSAKGFELNFTLTDLTGRRSEFMNRSSHEPEAKLRYGEDKTFLVVVTSPAGGGSGTYLMRFDRAKLEELTLGKTVQYQEGPAMGTYRLKVEKGTRYQLLTIPHGESFDLYDEKGDWVQPYSMQFGDKRATFFTARASGEYTIYVGKGTSQTRFRVYKHVLPDLGGE